MKKTIDFVVDELSPDFVSFSTLRIYPIGLINSEKNGLGYDNSLQFNFLRPNNEIITGKNYDNDYYVLTDKKEIRNKHDIFSAFGGLKSINPPELTPKVCYELLLYLLDKINMHNLKNKNKITPLLSDYFEKQYITITNGIYSLKPFEEIKSNT
jgi:hypothetical protein